MTVRRRAVRKKPVVVVKSGLMMRGLKATRHIAYKALNEWPLHITTVVLIAIVMVIAPQQLGLLVYKAALITLPTVITYWISRWILHLDVKKLDSGNLTREEQRDLVILIAAAMIAAGLAA